jgi:hypothetical protein
MYGRKEGRLGPSSLSGCVRFGGGTDVIQNRAELVERLAENPIAGKADDQVVPLTIFGKNSLPFVGCDPGHTTVISCRIYPKPGGSRARRSETKVRDLCVGG